ncbi:UNVERIFIED_CONTAM: Retrovirus-related Pol polyprotein from transposon [Sesamum indicum]
MADRTRLKELQEAQKKTEVVVLDEKAKRQASEEELHNRMDQMEHNMIAQHENLQASILNMEHNMLAMQQQMQSMVEQLQLYNKNKSVLGEGLTAFVEKGSSSREGAITFRQETQSPRQIGSYNTLNKLEFPYFDGENARSWVRRCTRYFQMIPIPEDQKGRLNYGTKDILKKGEIPSWDELVKSILEKFEDLDYERVMTAFNRLQQETTVNAYLERFEELKDQMLVFNKNMEEEFLMMKFISGLKDEIKSLVTPCEPTSLSGAIVLARRQEYAMNAILKKTQPINRNPHPKPPYKPPLKNPPLRSNFQPKRLLTEAEVKAKKEKNLYYRCDEPFVSGHKCRYRQFYMLLEDEEAREIEGIDPKPTEYEEHEVKEGDLTVSLHAMKRHVHCKTLRMIGKVGDKEILILIDSGSTHCFLDEKVARTLNCEIESSTPMMIRVADGSKLASNLICNQFTWDMQGHKFTHPVRLIKLVGYDLVIGCDWLSHYNPVELDFNQAKVTLNLPKEKLVLYALPKTARDMSVNSMLYQDVFQEPKSLPPERSIQYSIELLSDAIPKKQHPYRYAYGQKTEIERLVKEMLGNGIIRPSQSSFASPVLLVKKKDGGWRLCVDYRYLNNLTVKHNFPIPVIDELLDELYGAKFFSKIDLRSGYFQIRMKEDDIPKTSFITHSGHYEFLQGLGNAPSAPQKSNGPHEETPVNRVEYLGHIISGDGVATDPAKIDSMVNWPVPSNVKALRGFLGLTGYYRRFIKNYGSISKPLTSLLRKNAFEWNLEAGDAFKQLKKVMTTARVLSMPDFSKPFIVETDASGKGIGVVLMQEGRPITYLMTKWRHYLLGNHFIIRTDQRSLKHILDQRVDSMLQQKWVTKLLGFGYEVQYKKGNENRAADALSRVEHEENDLQSHAISAQIPMWMQEVQASYEGNTLFQTVAQAKIIDSQSFPDYTYEAGVLRRKGKICIGSHGEIREKILKVLHDSALGGHSGIVGTYQRGKLLFYWPTMKADIQNWVKECEVCQRSKHENCPYPGLLQPLPIPDQAWLFISMDFVEGLQF